MRALLVELRACADDLRTAWREFVSPSWDQPDEPDTTTSDQIARWVGEHRHPDGG